MKELPAATDPLTFERYANATVMPVTPYPQPRRAQAFKFGVFDSRGDVVRPSLLFRSYGKMGFAAELQPAARTYERAVLFGGRLSPHFGHFILESLSRLWAAKTRPDLPIAWAVPSSSPPSRLTTWQQQILDVLGIKNDVLLVAEPTRFGEVVVAQAGYRIKDFFARQQAAFLACYPERPREPGRKLWLTRAAVDDGRGSIHVRRLDRELARNGWTIERPEQLSVSEQLELLATASHVAGEEGSAFHLLVMLTDVRGLKVDIICRRPDRTVEQQNANYQTIAQTIGLDQRLHVVPEETVLATHRGKVTKVATTLAGHLEAVGIARPESLPAEASSTALDELTARVAGAIAAQSYLGISSREMATAAGPVVPLRHLVTPMFRSDPRRSAAEGVALYEMPPDEFMVYCAARSQQYDLICLDAPGSGEQLRRWFIASRRHAHDGTVWLLRGSDERSDPLAIPALRTIPVVTADGVCRVMLGPATDADALESAALSG